MLTPISRQARPTARQAGCHYLHEKVEHARVQSLRQGVPRVTRLLHVQRHVDGLQGVSPLAVHLPAGQLLFEARLVDA